VDLPEQQSSSAPRQPPYLCRCCNIAFALSPASDICPRCGEQCEPEEETIGEKKVAICRANLCGHYDAERDRCLHVIATKGRNKPGHINYLLLHSGVSCPLGFHNSIE
jgi:hypothetical protein